VARARLPSLTLVVWRSCSVAPLRTSPACRDPPCRFASATVVARGAAYAVRTPARLGC
jgi:hypothetical protein